MAALNIDFNRERELCQYCNSVSVEVDTNGILICRSCSRECGNVQVNQFRQFVPISKPKQLEVYDRSKNREKLFKALEFADAAFLSCEVVDAIEKYKNKNKKIKWNDLKSMMPKKFVLRQKWYHSLPKYLGFEYKFDDSWYTMADQVDVVLEKNGERLNNLFVLYQCVKLCGYYTEWIPLSLGKYKQKQLNVKWRHVCAALGWEFLPYKEDGFVHLVDKKVSNKEIGYIKFKKDVQKNKIYAWRNAYKDDRFSQPDDCPTFFPKQTMEQRFPGLIEGKSVITPYEELPDHIKEILKR